MSTTRMPFGAHKGRRLSEVPEPYLRWLAERRDLWASLREAVEAELARRSADAGTGSPPMPRGPVDATVAEQLIGAGLRTLAKRVHPDVGGRHEDMVAVGQAADWLRSRVRELAS